jgi:Immunity protein 44
VRVWTSSEALIDVDEALNLARKDVEREVAKSLASKNYGSGVSKWALIYILLPENDPKYPEVRRYRKRTRVVEFRLKVDHQAFKEGGAIAQRKLLAAAFLRSIDLSGSLPIEDFDRTRFKADVVQVFERNNWV